MGNNNAINDDDVIEEIDSEIEDSYATVPIYTISSYPNYFDRVVLAVDEIERIIMGSA